MVKSKNQSKKKEARRKNDGEERESTWVPGMEVEFGKTLRLLAVSKN